MSALMPRRPALGTDTVGLEHLLLVPSPERRWQGHVDQRCLELIQASHSRSAADIRSAVSTTKNMMISSIETS